ncbi:MAG: bifunctional (p)ppGpp synthetase/guanosine-3',5'-bis(diphosphate) 3'-pyrophosphohydrolase [Pseudopedobacter saltans]|uniref:Bifunctional (P)ppGpp synthetase/guanosine-3',5'-bis(Diphosphate) 3'-pyrophosphohydrolase n=1 Tax=Pseudopedobacter saltans TaxID=151895 RepID=A0A2W5HCA0_9SPHI|nr:MAG: bifunctional (p)ppGpp synthetase/guanosine-3',5'-bis(diphosphate) 3'-pyrophosphohydrolase [Pseudopedobacter saltans]
MNIQTIYQDTIRYAAERHEAIHQKIPSTDITYVVHLSNVAMEIMIASMHTTDFDLAFAVRVALLHDVLEDTETSYQELVEQFDDKVANAVLSLTKNNSYSSKTEKIEDSLERIKKQPKEVWAVKLADRITNLQIPPKHWDAQKIENYRNEAIMILDRLRGGNTYLENRLETKIEEYKIYL